MMCTKYAKDMHLHNSICTNMQNNTENKDAEICKCPRACTHVSGFVTVTARYQGQQHLLVA